LDNFNNKLLIHLFNVILLIEFFIIYSCYNKILNNPFKNFYKFTSKNILKTLKTVVPIILFFVIISFTISENNYVFSSMIPTSTVVKVSVRNHADSIPISGAFVVVTGPSNHCCGFTDQNGMFGCTINDNGNVTVCAAKNGKYHSYMQYCAYSSCEFEMYPNNNGQCFCDWEHPEKH
jgi:hypothetical protein